MKRHENKKKQQKTTDLIFFAVKIPLKSISNGWEPENHHVKKEFHDNFLGCIFQNQLYNTSRPQKNITATCQHRVTTLQCS